MAIPSPRRVATLSLIALLAVTGPASMAAPGATSSPPTIPVRTSRQVPAATADLAALAGGPQERARRQVFLMGTRVTLVTVAADRPTARDLLDRLLAGLEATEAELSTWREDSLLTAVNRQPVGTPRPAPEELCDLLDELRRWHRASDGAFDPAIGSLIRAWGLRDGGRLPAPGELDRARRRAGLEHLAVDRSPCRITRTREITLDAGAFGKGAALDRLVARDDALREATWMVDLGGQVTVHGADEPWPVALAHPQRRREAILELRLRSGSLATSGGSVRDLRVDGRQIGHVVDPRSGETISRNASVSVWHPGALEADVLSTAIYVMGIEPGLEWAESRRVAACFLVPDPGGREVEIRATAAFRERFLRPAG